MLTVVAAETTAPFLSVLVIEEDGSECLVLNAPAVAEYLRSAG